MLFYRPTYKTQQLPRPTEPDSTAVCDSLQLHVTMKTHHFSPLLLIFLFCSKTLASSSSDSERTVSNPGLPVRPSSPLTSPTTPTSGPSLTRFVRFDDIVQRPAQAAQTAHPTQPAQPTRPTQVLQSAQLVRPARPSFFFAKKRPDPNSLSAQLERSRAYYRKEEQEKSAKAPPVVLSKEARRQEAMKLYLRKKKSRAKAAGTCAVTPIRPTSHFPLTSEGHPIFGPQPYKPRKGSKAKSQGSNGGGRSDGEWTPAGDGTMVNQKNQSKTMGEGKESAAYKIKGKGKASG
ncbi:hypothetical protein BCV69DRAFT_311457 [Microstroma glucosiphilum]|uniref:Uncharacterized protein n=1 Tax=Pseudomicrostroma glucosiphilum TaxID=1684307 RepID=A0A316U9A0_9BASI|nr:hypothetical protein BCV69DRAFT_311457 [Pseudomicrostroma glucosiphilum]PWN21729.1 hypothetical protein BCV69DRAFT_311457 [Pseudomicrostroma glucosiphilum]